MNTIRKVSGFFMAVLLAAFALPSSAQTKIYSINVTPLPTVATTTTNANVAVTIRNETPNGNSTINSFTVYLPTDVKFVSFGTPAASGTPILPTPTYDATAKAVKVNGFTGLASGNKTPKSLTINLVVNYNPIPSCTSSYTWTADVRAGNSFNGDPFAPVTGTSSGTPTTPTQLGTCKYSLSITPASVYAGRASTSLTARVTNDPSSTSLITSLTLITPAGLTINGSNTVSFSNLAISPNNYADIPVTVSAPCTAAGGSWGSSVPGFSPPASQPSTTVQGTCSLNVAAPPSATTGVPFQLQVTASDGNNQPIPTFTGPVSFALSPARSFTPANPQDCGGALPCNLTITDIGTYALTATSTVGSKSLNVTIASFTVYTGTLNCNGDLTPNTNPTGVDALGLTNGLHTPGYVAGKRGPGNKDGIGCIEVNYTFTNAVLDPSKKRVTLRWDTGVQPNAVFFYSATWNDEDADPSTGMPFTTSRTKVYWEFNPDGSPKYVVFGVRCLSPNFPTPYANLDGGIDDQLITTTVNLNATVTIPAGTPIVIGNERMTVTVGGTGTSFTVLRAQGGTTAAAHPSGAPVMSTPLPIDPNRDLPGAGPSIPPASTNPYFNKQANVCILDEGWEAVGDGMVRFTTTIFDIGDGGVGRGF